MVGVSNGKDDGEDTLPGRRSVWGVLSVCLGQQIEPQSIQKIIQRGLRWPPSHILHTSTNKKYSGVTEGGWDRMRNQVGTLGEHDSIVLGLLSVPKRDPSKYAKEGNITKDNDEYAVGNNGNDKPPAKGGNDDNVPIAKKDNDRLFIVQCWSIIYGKYGFL
jgi:hypothetical protein